MLQLLGRTRRFAFAIVMASLLSSVNSRAEDGDSIDNPHKPTIAGVEVARSEQCQDDLSEADSHEPAIKRAGRRAQKNRSNANSETVSPQPRTGWTLKSFFAADPEMNLALKHPFTIANAAEKAYAMIMHLPPRDALDPLYRTTPIKVYPMLAGEHPATEGRMVVGQEDAVSAFVSFLYSIARGDRVGKSLGFPGPAGTGKTELLYVLANLEKNLGKVDKYRQFSYRWKNLHHVPFLSPLMKARDGRVISEFFDPDLPRSPFTLLRADMQQKILNTVRGPIRTKQGILISEGWEHPEPKSGEIIRRIFEYHFPDIANGLMTVDDLTEDQYLDTLGPYLVIVPKSQLRPARPEPEIIRAQTDNPNYQALSVSPNVVRSYLFADGYQNPLSVDYTGKIPQQDGGLLMFDELFRNPAEFLTLTLEVIQNHVIEADFGKPVKLDIVPVWNSNDESIEKAAEDGAIKALINRTDAPAMRSLLPPNQIEAVLPFQVGLKRFKMRKLEDTELVPFVHSEVYPAPDAHGRTFSAQGRYALYYDLNGTDILIAPYALNYISWLSSATRFVTEPERLKAFENELNLVRGNSGILTSAVGRLRIALGDKIPEKADLMELSRVKDLLREGESGISFRDLETWLKVVVDYAAARGKTSVTPLLVDQVFQNLLDKGRVKVTKADLRARWQLIRQHIKIEVLLPRLDEQVKSIVSGDGQRAERKYDEIENEFLALASNRNATEVAQEDGSQNILINIERLQQVRDIYRQKFGKEFEPNFLLRQLSGARRGKPVRRDPDLLEAVRIYLARQDTSTADYISAFDTLYRGDSVDPEVQKRAAEVEPMLSRYGYDSSSFKEAVAFVAQLVREERRGRDAQLR